MGKVCARVVWFQLKGQDTVGHRQQKMRLLAKYRVFVALAIASRALGLILGRQSQQITRARRASIGRLYAFGSDGSEEDEAKKGVIKFDGTTIAEKVGFPQRLSGDFGFDPLGIANRDNLFTLREVEMKNARIAMLAALGWPSAELSHLIIAGRLGKVSLLGEDGRAPSVLNGGLNNSFALFALGLFFAIGSVLELELLRKREIARKQSEVEAFDRFFDLYEEEDQNIPGNYQWDPLNFERKVNPGGDPERRALMQAVEIFNGRVAMLATVGYIVQEYLTKVPVVKETPQFFYGVLTPGM